MNESLVFVVKNKVGGMTKLGRDMMMGDERIPTHPRQTNGKFPEYVDDK